MNAMFPAGWRLGAGMVTGGTAVGGDMKPPSGEVVCIVGRRIVGRRLVGCALLDAGAAAGAAGAGAENGIFLDGGGADAAAGGLGEEETPPPRKAFFIWVTIIEPNIKNPNSKIGLTDPRRIYRVYSLVSDRSYRPMSRVASPDQP